MSSQLAYLYSYNRTAKRPFSTILHTSFSPTASPRLWEKMSRSNWEKWTRTYSWAEGLEDLPKGMTSALNGSSVNPPQTAESVNTLESHFTGPYLPPNLHSTQKLIYLSADSPHEMTILSEDEIYIIGGIVDRNRYKVDHIIRYVRRPS